MLCFSSRAAAPFLLGCALLATSCSGSLAGSHSLAVSNYARQDTNKLTVVSPRVRGSLGLTDSVRVSGAYTMDHWTGASLDIVTAASERVTEQRHEGTLGASVEFADARVSAGYRHSRENDYWSNGGSLAVALDMAQDNATLELGVWGGRDTVGRAGDPSFNRPQQTLGGRVAFTQVLDARSLAQVSLEHTRVTGFQSSPYRTVGLDGLRTCQAGSLLCAYEVVPDLRMRNAAVLRARRALGERLSVGARYRFYFDDWGVQSHTIGADLAARLSESTRLSVDYRYYTQDKADFYRPLYASNVDRAYITRDRELTTFYTHRLLIELDHELEWQDGDRILHLGLRAGPTRYVYLNLIGLDDVHAVEGTVSARMEWP